MNLPELISLAANGLTPADYAITHERPSMPAIEVTVDGQPVDPAALPIEQKRELARAMFPGLEPRYLTAWDALRKEEAGK